MPYNADGTWVDGGNDTVASRVSQLQSQDSSLMRGAIASGTKAAARRGLVNSSMGVGAGVQAGLAAVTPIASADASNQLNRDIATMEDTRTRDLNAATLASNERSAYANSTATATANYQNAIANTLQNSDIPAETRSAVQSDLASIYKSSQQNLAAIYGAKLSW